MAFFGHFGCSFDALCIWEVLALLVYPSCVQGSGYAGVPAAGHAHWAEVGGGIYLRDLQGVHWFAQSSPFIFLEIEVIPMVKCSVC